MIIIYAILSTLALAFPIINKKLKAFCDKNNISYDITVHLTRNFSRRRSPAFNTDEHTNE